MSENTQKIKQHHEAEQKNLSVQICQIREQIKTLTKNCTALEDRRKEISTVINTISKIDEMETALKQEDIEQYVLY